MEISFESVLKRRQLSGTLPVRWQKCDRDKATELRCTPKHSVHFAAGTYTLSAVTSSVFGTSVSNLTCRWVGFLSALARKVSLY